MPASGWGRAAGTTLSTRVYLLCLKYCAAEAALFLHPRILVSLHPCAVLPGLSNGTANTEQGSPVIMG